MEVGTKHTVLVSLQGARVIFWDSRCSWLETEVSALLHRGTKGNMELLGQLWSGRESPRGGRTGNQVTHIRVPHGKTAVPHWIRLPISGMLCFSQLYTGMFFGNAATNKTRENKTPNTSEKQTNPSGTMNRK